MLIDASILAAAFVGACTVTDDDTIRCGNERIRLLGIDAPEMGACPPNRQCVGNGSDSREALRYAMAGKNITIRRVGIDRYERTLAVVYADGMNLSCHMISIGQAEYVERWDNEGLVSHDCPLTIR